MKNIINRKYPVISFALTAITISLLFPACLKDKGPVQDYSGSPSLVGFQYYGSASTLLKTSLLPNPVDTVNVEVTLSAQSITLTSPVTVTIAPYQQGVDSLNAVDTAAHYTFLPSDKYTIANGGVVTINPGQQIVSLPVYINASAVDYSANPVLSLQITKVDGGPIVASNLSVANLVLLLKNVYDGEYTVDGSFIDGFGGITDDGIYPLDVYLITTSPNSDEWYDVTQGYYHLINSGGALSVYGEFSPVFIFDAQGNVTAVGNHYGFPTIFDPSPTRLRTAQLDPTGVNKYDFATKTLQVSYILVQAGTQRTFFNETFHYVGPRP